MIECFYLSRGGMQEGGRNSTLVVLIIGQCVHSDTWGAELWELRALVSYGGCEEDEVQWRSFKETAWISSRNATIEVVAVATWETVICCTDLSLFQFRPTRECNNFLHYDNKVSRSVKSVAYNKHQTSAVKRNRGRCIWKTLLLCVWTSDLVNGLVLLMNSNISSPVNLVSSSNPASSLKIRFELKMTLRVYVACLQGNPEEHTILEFARLIKSLVGKASIHSFIHSRWRPFCSLRPRSLTSLYLKGTFLNQ